MVFPFMSQLTRVRLPTRLLIRIHIETLRIPRIPHRWYDRTPVLPVVDIFPDHASEEGVLFYSRGAAGDVAESVGAVDCAELLDDILCFV
jgi:hypothetical protein